MAPVFRSQIHSSITIDSQRPKIQAQQVVSAMERVVLTQDSKIPNAEFVDAAKDLIVVADVVEICGPLSLPERSVKIFARVLASRADSKGQAAKIDISGNSGGNKKDRVSAPGKLSPAEAGHTALAIVGFHNPDERDGKEGARGSNGNKGAQGNPGGNAWDIEIVCSEPDSGLKLPLIARGGRGQDGQDGQNGQDGQDGGQGAEGTAGTAGIGLKFGTKGGKGGNGGDGAVGGVGGSGGNGGRVTVAFTKGLRDEMVTIDVRGGDMGNAGESGSGGRPGSGGKSYPSYIAQDLYYWIEQEQKDGSGGDPGNTPNQIGNPQNQAKAGSQQKLTFTNTQMAERALPAQCSMLMQRIRSTYLSADPVENPNAYKTASELLAWVQSLTEFWTTQAQNDSKPRILTATYRQCMSLTQRLRLGLTYYGHPRSFAPRASLAFYQNLLEKACKTLEDLEADSIAYQTAVEKHEEAASKLRRSDDNAQAQISALAAQRDDINGRLLLVEGALKAAHDKVIAQEVEVTTKLQHFQTEIQLEEGLSIDAFVKVVTSITPPKEGGALDILKVVGKTALDIKGVFDAEAKTQYKINRISTLREGLKPLAEAYKESQGMLTMADPNGYKLLASRKALDEQLKKYWGRITADEVRTAVDQLLNLSEQRNQLVMDFNAMRGQLADIAAQAAEAQAQRDAVAAGLQKNARPDLPEFSAWVSDLYEKARGSVIEQVYLASRAYSWWALKEFPIYTRLGLKSASTVTAGILKAAKGQLLSEFATAVEGRGSAPSPFPSKEARKINPAATGAIVKIDAQNFSRAFHELRTHRETILELPPTVPYTTMIPIRPAGETGDMKAFDLLAEVMINKARVYLRGARTSDRKFAVNIVHGGVNRVVARNGHEYVFTSVPVHLLFKYVETTGGVTNIDFDGNITEETGKGNYAPLSPFGWWRIYVDPIANRDLDLSGLTAVEIEFHGDAYSFPS
jgi:hypothetical protein